MPTPTIIYDATSDWQPFAGSTGRVFSGVLRLAYADTAASLGLTGLLRNYRFGQNQNLTSTVGTGNAAAFVTKGSGSANFTAEGVKCYGTGGAAPTSANCGVVQLGGDPLDYTIIQMEADAKGVSFPLHATVWSFWTRFGVGLNNVTGSILGWGADYVEPQVDYLWPAKHTAYTLSKSVGGRLFGAADSEDMGGFNPIAPINFVEGSERGSIQGYEYLPEWVYDGKPHHVLVHHFWGVDPSDGAPHFRFRYFVDGRWLFDYVNWPESYGGPRYMLGTRYSTNPAVLGTASMMHDWGMDGMPGPGYGEPQPPYDSWGPQTIDHSTAYGPDNPWPEFIDEVAIARCDVALDAGGARIIDPTGLWSQGDQVLTPPKRHPDPAVVGYTDPTFIMTGPVVHTGVAGSAINYATCTLTDPPGSDSRPVSVNRIQIATRASDTSFASTDSSLPWSNWYDLVDGSQITMGSRGTGAYVQCRLRIFPTSDPMCLTSPGVDSLGLALASGAVLQDGTSILMGSIAVGQHSFLPGRIQVQQTGSSDLLGRINVFDRGVSTLSGRVRVKDSSQLQGKVAVKYRSLLPGRIQVVIETGESTLPGRIEVTSHVSFLKGRIDVRGLMYSFLLGRINVPLHYLPGRISVWRRGVSRLSGRITILPDLPGPVLNLDATLPLVTWQSNSNVTLTWQHAVPHQSPVIAYYYAFTTLTNQTPTLGWQRTTATSVALSMVNAGKWHFTIAALDQAGFFGPAVTCEVWLNNPPSIPGALVMAINGMDTAVGRPLVARSPVAPGHILTWTAATDPDLGDAGSLVYEIQIAMREDFGPDPATGAASIVRSYQNISTTTMNWADVPQSGLLFWRIRASDGKQSSSWSRAGSFTVNMPPLRVEHLTARQR